jgi:RHS repeat-associated protein
MRQHLLQTGSPLRVYSPFGVVLEGRSWSAGSGYRYGFNGKEKDDEGMGGGGQTYDYGFRIYNPSLAKFLSVDPLSASYPWFSPYHYASNRPVWCVDIDGLEGAVASAPVVMVRPLPAPLNGVRLTTTVNQAQINRHFSSPIDAHNYYITHPNEPTGSWIRYANDGKTIIQSGTDYNGDGLPELVWTKAAYYELGYDKKDASLPAPPERRPEDCDDWELEEAVLRIAEGLGSTGDYQLEKEYFSRHYYNWLYSQPFKSVALIKDDCKLRAIAIQSNIGGEFLYIKPAPPYARITEVTLKSGEKLQNEWFWHVAVLMDGIVYDAMTGSMGMPVEEYKKLFKEGTVEFEEKTNLDGIN